MIELLKPYHLSPKGAILDCPVGVEELLIRRGIAKKVEEAKRRASPPENKRRQSSLNK